MSSYKFANINNINNGIIITPNGSLNDNSIIMDKKVGDFVNYINEYVLGPGYCINKPFLYDLVSVEIIDPILYNNQSTAEFCHSMGYILALAKAFGKDNIRIQNLTLDFDNQKLHKYTLTFNGVEDTWVLDGSKDKLYIKNGKTEYSLNYNDKDENGNMIEVSIFDRNKSIPMWMFAVNRFFNDDDDDKVNSSVGCCCVIM